MGATMTEPDREVKARKQHRCLLCGLRIRKGAMYWQRKCYSDEFPPNVMKMHAVCREASSGWGWDDWETWMDDYAEFRKYDLGLPLIGGRVEPTRG